MADTPDAASPSVPALPKRKLYASYGIGLFAITLQDIYALIVPLFALSIGCSPAEVGLLVGAKGAGPAIFAMHGGALIDRFGTRRMLLGCSMLTAIAAILIPALPWFWPLFFLQLVSGLLTTFNWISAQSGVAQLCGGDARTLGQYNFAIRIGTIGGPIAIGAMWDFFGAWPTFSAIAVWAVGLHFLSRTVPEPNQLIAAAPMPKLIEVLPKISDYTRSLKLMVIPAIAFSIVVSTLRNGSNGIQQSTYLVFLQDLGYAGTALGTLFATVEVAVALASLFVGTAKRLGPSEWVLLATSIIAIIAISATPIVGPYYPLLLLMMALIGACQGFMQPIMFSIQTRAVGPEHQGAVVGLRMTANRFSAMAIPPIAGAIAEVAGLEKSFYYVGGGFLVAALIVGVVIALRPDFRLGDKNGD